MGPWRVLVLAAALAVASACARRAAPPPTSGPKIAFTPIPEADAAKVTNPHAGPGGKPLCQRCHVAGEAGTRTDPISLCSECHDVGLMRHPFRVEAPAEPAASGLPLMPGRIVACHTCHEPHDVKARRGGLRTAYRELCVSCHVKHGQRSVLDVQPAADAPGASKELHAPGMNPAAQPPEPARR